MSNIGHNSGEVTSAEKVKLHHNAIIAAARMARDISEQLKDLKHQPRKTALTFPL